MANHKSFTKILLSSLNVNALKSNAATPIFKIPVIIWTINDAKTVVFNNLIGSSYITIW